MLPPVLLPPATQALGHGSTGHLFQSPASIAALAFVTAGALEAPSALTPASSTGVAAASLLNLQAMSTPHPDVSAEDPVRLARRPFSEEESAAIRASTDQAYFLYGKEISLLRGDARLRALLDAADEETPLATADRVLTLDLDLLKRVSALIDVPYPDDWSQAADAQVADWRKSMIPKILFNLMTASHYKAIPPPVTAESRAAGPRLALSLRDAQAMVWRQGTVRDLQLRVAVLHDHFPVLLSRMRASPALRIPADFASVEHFPMELLTALMDFLNVQEYIRALLLRAASQAVPLAGALKSQRAQQSLKSLDAPLCELYSSGDLKYRGSSVENVFGLFPVGTLSMCVVLTGYVGSSSAVVDQFYELLRNLSFLNHNGSFSIGAAKLRISEALMKVDGPPLVLNIRTAYDLLVGAVDRAGPVHPLLQQWAPFFIEQLAERNDARGIEPLPRSYLDGALARLEKLSKAESYISSLRDGPSTAVASLSDLDGPPNMLAPWPGAYALVEVVDLDYISAVSSTPNAYGSARIKPACDKCTAPLDYGTDYCYTCDAFTSGTMCCTGCGAPTSQRFVALKICRGTTSLVPCNVTGKAPPPPFRTPNASDLFNARVRHTRLCEVREKRLRKEPYPFAGGGGRYGGSCIAAASAPLPDPRGRATCASSCSVPTTVCTLEQQPPDPRCGMPSHDASVGGLRRLRAAPPDHLRLQAL